MGFMSNEVEAIQKLFYKRQGVWGAYAHLSLIGV